jgi:hypothetical protein
VLDGEKIHALRVQKINWKVIVMLLPLFPLLLLVTAIVSIVCYQRTRNDTFGVLGVSTTLACLIWGLVVAHWSIHLLSLILLARLRSPLLSLVAVESD